MRRVGVRELKQNASQVLAAVKAGETVEVTEHGRPVAMLVPTTPKSEYERLLEAGDIAPGGQRVLDVEPAVVPGLSLSAELAAMRDEDWR
jgi:prevent-host-death family protein